MFSEIKPHIQLLGGTLSVDDTVIDKPYSNPNLTELIGYFWSLELMRAEELIENWYEVQRNLYRQVARGFILEHLIQKLDLYHIINLLSMRKFYSLIILSA